MTVGIVYFAPSKSSHVARFVPLMGALASRGFKVRLLCMDPALPPRWRTGPSIEKTGYPCDFLPGAYIRPTLSLPGLILQRRRLISHFRRILSSQALSAVITGADHAGPSRCLIQTARDMSIPTALLADGIQVPVNPRWRPSAAARFWTAVVRTTHRVTGLIGPRGSSGVDRLLLMTESDRRELGRDGIAPERLIVTGSPAYDELAHQSNQPAEPALERRIRDRAGISSDRPVVFFAHQAFCARTQMQSVLQELVGAVRQCDATLLVKFHPSSVDNPVQWRAWSQVHLDDPARVVFAKSEISSIEGVRLARACVTFWSTVALEAMIVGTPLVVIQYTPTRHALSYGREYGAAIDVDRPEDLAPAVVAAVRDEDVRKRLRANARKTLNKEMFGLDGRSVDRIIDAIVALIAVKQTAGDRDGVFKSG
jgi:hypothetical protein